MEVIITIQHMGDTNTHSRTLFDKIWSRHCVKEVGRDNWLLHVDRHLIHDLVAGPALTQLSKSGRTVRSPALTYATVDHGISSAPGRTTDTNPIGGRLLRQMRQRVYETGIRLFDLGQEGQGIVHVMGPELGLTLPGMFVVCGDSHTCTHGGLGALAFGIGSSEVVHVLATQTLRQRKPASMRIRFEGQPGPQVTAKDLILFAIGKLGTAAGRGHAVEYAGSTVRSFGIESRLTMCNLSIELGAKIGLIAPDEVTFEYVSQRSLAPKAAMLDKAIVYWRSLPSDEDARFAIEHRFDASSIAPQITWGTSPQDVISVADRVPNPDNEPNGERRRRMQLALDYMGLRPGAAIAGTKVDWVFIGSCANSRLSDLRSAAEIIGDRKVAPGVKAWVVPGSESVKRQAQREGLDRVFTAAGFQWREPGCSLCVAANGELVGPAQRCISTSNRNFVGRQGPSARTHLASPAMAAAAALTGVITDVRHISSLPDA
jgi:3-isopropylmalate/(R)-2-methylmalate dehydratase large subunit